MLKFACLLLATLTAAQAGASLPIASLDHSWIQAIGPEFQKPYFRDLETFLETERRTKTILPEENLTFTALNLVTFDQVRVVIIGQDPYQTVDKKTGIPFGHGLAFSIRPEITTVPPSLNNIFKKLNREMNIPISKKGDLTKWADQGVLMINALLTVEKDKAGSHKDKPSKTANWEVFTNAMIEAIASKKQNVVFLLWGGFAKSKRALIDKYPQNHHLILEAQHPSPLAAAKPSFVDGPPVFTPVNEFLKSIHQPVIDWDVTKP